MISVLLPWALLALIVFLAFEVQRLKWRLKDLSVDALHRRDFANMMKNNLPANVREWVEERIVAAIKNHEHGHFERCQDAARLQIGLTRFEVRALCVGVETQFSDLYDKEKFSHAGGEYIKKSGGCATISLHDGSLGHDVGFPPMASVVRLP